MRLAERLAQLDARPPSIAEWEDLLVRLEVMPRALRTTLELGEPRPGVEEAVLEELVERERTIGAWLQCVAAGGPTEAPSEVPGSSDPPPTSQEPWDPRERAEAFARLRARTFAMVQRRGLEVWDWSGTLEDDLAPVTVYQALTHLVREDVRSLARLRAGPLG